MVSPRKGLGKSVDLLVHQVVDHLGLVLLGDGAGADRQKPGAEHGSNVGVPGPAGGIEVSRDLVLHESIVGKVPIEAVDHIVPVAPGIGHGDVFVQAAGIGVAGDVQPVAAPAFAVAGRGQQAVHQPGEGPGSLVAEKLLDFLFRGGQAVQVELGPAEQRQLAGAGSRIQVFFLQLAQHEGIHRRPNPARIAHFRRLGVAQGLKRPPVGNPVGIMRIFLPGSARLDPFSQDLHFLRRESAAHRHFQLSGLEHGQVEQALFRVPGNNGGTAVAALEQGLPLAEIQARDARLPVAGQAMLPQESPGFFRQRGVGRQSLGRAGGQHEDKDGKDSRAQTRFPVFRLDWRFFPPSIGVHSSIKAASG